MKYSIVPAIILTVLAVCITAWSPALGEGTKPGEVIVNRVCDQCHTMTRICYNLGKSDDFWFSTVARMISNGAPLKRSEIEPAASYLAGLEPGSEAICH